MSNQLQTGNKDYSITYRHAAYVLYITLGYFASAKLGLAIPYVGSHITLIWLPTGIAVAALMRWGYRCWPGIFVGALATNYSIDSSLFLALSIALGNTLAPLLTVFLLRRLKFHSSLDRAYDTLLLVLAAAIGMLLSASGGIFSLVLFKVLSPQNSLTAWLSWWAGDFIGVLLAAPLLLNISLEKIKELSAQWVEFLAWSSIMLVICWGVFFLNNNAHGHSLPLVFIILPLVVWSAMRFGVVGSSVGVLLPVFIAALATSHAIGPFNTTETLHSLFLLWIFIATLVLIDLIVAALQAGHMRANQALQQSELQLRTIIETEPECVKLMAQDGTVLQMNPAGLRMLGADTPEQIVGQKALGIVAPHHRQAFVALAQRVFEGESGHLEFEVIGLQGVHRWLETYEVPMRDAQGKITSMLGVTRDITEHKQAEDKIHRRSEELVALLEVSREIAATLDIQSVLQTTTDRVTELTQLKSAAIYLLEGETLHLWAETPPLPPQFPEELVTTPLANHPHIRQAITTGQPVFMLDTATADLTPAERAVTELRGLRSILYLPLLAGTKVLGTLIVATVGAPQALSEAEVDLCRTLANMAALALENARLYESSQHHAADLEQRIIERKKTDDAMRIAAVTFETQEAILITNPDGEILRVNQAFQDITGYSATEMAGKNPRILQSGRHDAAFYQAMWSTLLNTGKWMGEIWDKRKNGEIYPKLITITAVRDDDQRVTHYVAVFRDISNRKQSEQAIHQLAFFDPLTKLPNRRLFLDRLQQALSVSARNKKHGALLFLDLDHFKIINDTKGHAMGDQLLIEVANRLTKCVREDDSVARLGGDEFVVLLEALASDADEASSQAELIAEKIRVALDKPYMLNEYECLSSASIGISLFHGHLESANDLLQHADVAMYHSKTDGRNAIRFFNPQMQAALDMRAGIEKDLRHALDKDQFLLHYQIQVNNLRQPIGAEVLLRWKHPERGLVSPIQFIPLAEETGLIVKIGLWVLQTACTQLNIWQNNENTRDLTLAVNVSAKQFRHTDFVAQVQRVLQESGARPSHLKLELTESTVLENVEDTISKMNQIKALGVSFSMDDFGTGYSSLQYLKRLPLNQIKIDQSFVRDIATDPNDAAIVQTIIAMTEALGLDVIAEGVETEAQLEFIELRGCLSFQGYLFGKPVPVEQFESMLHKNIDSRK